MQDYHVHTTFSDGKNTPEEVVRAAMDLGLTELGFSDHSHTSFDPDCCMALDQQEAYRKEIARLKKLYAHRIRIFCGIEQDFYSETDTVPYDYVIGSVHYVRVKDAYVCVDDAAEKQLAGVKTYFGGDYYCFAEAYFDTVSDVVTKTHADIIGHFDLISKFNEQKPMFDPSHPRYIRAWQQAVDRLIPFGKPFEINTGAISRGYRTTPYPSPEIRDYIQKQGGRFILSSDSHRADTLCYHFSDFL